MSLFSVGSVVQSRGREWVVVPSEDPQVLLLRPLTGGEGEECGIYLPLVRLGLERIEQAVFPLPKAEEVGDAVGIELLFDAARLILRDGAGPFRSLGRVSIRPRAYQFVPLLMALRLNPVRMLIADDVGVGKTVEALLIARELLDRGEIKRLCVLCPPYLCEQWQMELKEKFHLEAVVVRSGTVSQLERHLPQGEYSIFSYYEYLVVSIDYVKSERHRDNFILHCPEFVIVDEAHGAAKPGSSARAQQQRHELLCRLAAKPDRHLILLTATPHSGIEESFLSLLGLLKPEFSRLDLSRLEGKKLDELARHFIQRKRADIVHWLNEETPFPQREYLEKTYLLSSRYRELFDRVYQFTQDLVNTSQRLQGWRRRIRFWAALSLLRCVMSSPAAAAAALYERSRKGGSVEEEGVSDELYLPYIYEPTDAETLDTQPAHIIEESEADLTQSERRQLRKFAQLAESIKGTEDDIKLTRCTALIAELLREGYHPIVWCRYIATSDYVAAELEKRLEPLFPGLKVFSVTGSLPEEDRRERVAELANYPYRVLVATDCLSEGINLQDHFTAVIHYDLPWNPNRLEQREGRVDRFGQRARVVKAILFYGQDNPVDGAVLDVLLRKAHAIHKTLGISVPVPMDSEAVLEAIYRALFSRASRFKEQVVQLRLFEDMEVEEFHRRWDRAAEREKESRTRFAQRSLRPEEVQRELLEMDAVLGDQKAVERFVLNACQRLGFGIKPGPNEVFTITPPPGNALPDFLQSMLPRADWCITFKTPPPQEGVDYLGRNHPFVVALARYLLEAALSQGAAAPASRCGVIKTMVVQRRTVLLLLRLRFLLEQPDKRPLLAEEVVVTAFYGFPPDRLEWLNEKETLTLLQDARADAAITPRERREVLEEVLGWWRDLLPGLQEFARQRAKKLEDAHRRVRAAARLARRGLSVRPQLPPDLLGLLVLQPVPKGVRK